MAYRLKASIDATRQVPGGEYTVKTPLAATGPGAALSSGVVGIPAGTLSGASFGVPLGDVASPELLLLQNGEQDLNVRLNGASSPLRVGPGGVLMINQEPRGDEQQVSSVSVSTVTTQAQAGSLTFIISGGPRPQMVDLSNVALWTVHDNLSLGPQGYRCQVIGYTDEQIASDYSGAPYVTMVFPGDVGHGVGVSPAGYLIVAAGWDVNSLQQGLYSLPINSRVPSFHRFELSEITRFNLQCFHPTNTNGEPRMAGFPVSDTRWLTMNSWIVEYDSSVFASGIGLQTASNQVLTSVNTDGGNNWDCDYDSSGNLWWCNMLAAGNTQAGIRMMNRARVAAGETGVVSFNKAFQGSNYGQIDGLAFDDVGGLYYSQWDPVRVAYLNAAVIAAGSGTPSNPAPTRTMTWPGPLDDSSSIVLTKQVDMWHSDWQNGKLRKFSRAQIEAGGLQTPLVTISTPPGFNPWTTRLRNDLAFHPR